MWVIFTHFFSAVPKFAGRVVQAKTPGAKIPGMNPETEKVFQIGGGWFII